MPNRAQSVIICDLCRIPRKASSIHAGPDGGEICTFCITALRKPLTGKPRRGRTAGKPRRGRTVDAGVRTSEYRREENERAAARRALLTPEQKAADRCRQYGITLDDYQQMRDAQHNACAICQREADAPYELHIDHDHDTGAVRGLLCGPCNQGLGRFRDDRGLLTAAIGYLARSVLAATPDSPYAATA
jgi:hypothetical protein